MFLEAIESGSDRACRRSHVLMTAMLMTPAGAASVRIRDISTQGAQLWSDSPVPTDCDAILKRGTFFAAGKIVWCSERSIGVKFYRELPDADFESAFNSRPVPARG
jgi:hypothetical protein